MVFSVDGQKSNGLEIVQNWMKKMRQTYNVPGIFISSHAYNFQIRHAFINPHFSPYNVLPLVLYIVVGCVFVVYM